jgi:hypothetical protein
MSSAPKPDSALGAFHICERSALFRPMQYAQVAVQVNRRGVRYEMKTLAR